MFIHRYVSTDMTYWGDRLTEDRLQGLTSFQYGPSFWRRPIVTTAGVIPAGVTTASVAGASVAGADGDRGHCLRSSAKMGTQDRWAGDGSS